MSSVELNEFEAAIPERIARMSRERLEQGREEYGEWEPTKDNRDFITMAEEEFVDGFAYLQAVRAEIMDLRGIVEVQAMRIIELEGKLNLKEVKLNSVTVDLKGGDDLGGLFDDIACDGGAELRFFDAVETDEGDILCAHESFTEAVWNWHGGDTSRVTWGARTCEIAGMTATRCENLRNGWKVPIEMWEMLTKEGSDE